MRNHDFPIVLALSLLVAACATNGSADAEGKIPDGAWRREIQSYHKVVSDDYGIVGYVEVWEYEQPPYEGSFRLFHVFDLDFRERGQLNETGTGHKFVYLAPEMARVLGSPFLKEELEAHPLEHNVGVVLDVPGELDIQRATPADLKRPGSQSGS